MYNLVKKLMRNKKINKKHDANFHMFNSFRLRIRLVSFTYVLYFNRSMKKWSEKLTKILK